MDLGSIAAPPCHRRGSNPHESCLSADFKSAASTDSATVAWSRRRRCFGRASPSVRPFGTHPLLGQVGSKWRRKPVAYLPGCRCPTIRYHGMHEPIANISRAPLRNLVERPQSHPAQSRMALDQRAQSPLVATEQPRLKHAGMAELRRRECFKRNMPPQIEKRTETCPFVDFADRAFLNDRRASRLNRGDGEVEAEAPRCRGRPPKVPVLLR